MADKNPNIGITYKNISFHLEGEGALDCLVDIFRMSKTGNSEFDLKHVNTEIKKINKIAKHRELNEKEMRNALHWIIHLNIITKHIHCSFSITDFSKEQVIKFQEKTAQFGCKSKMIML